MGRRSQHSCAEDLCVEPVSVGNLKDSRSKAAFAEVWVREKCYITEVEADELFGDEEETQEYHPDTLKSTTYPSGNCVCLSSPKPGLITGA